MKFEDDCIDLCGGDLFANWDDDQENMTPHSDANCTSTSVLKTLSDLFAAEETPHQDGVGDSTKPSTSRENTERDAPSDVSIPISSVKFASDKEGHEFGRIFVAEAGSDLFRRFYRNARKSKNSSLESYKCFSCGVSLLLNKNKDGDPMSLIQTPKEHAESCSLGPFEPNVNLTSPKYKSSKNSVNNVEYQIPIPLERVKMRMNFSGIANGRLLIREPDSSLVRRYFSRRRTTCKVFYFCLCCNYIPGYRDVGLLAIFNPHGQLLKVFQGGREHAAKCRPLPADIADSVDMVFAKPKCNSNLLPLDRITVTSNDVGSPNGVVYVREPNSQHVRCYHRMHLRYLNRIPYTCNYCSLATSSNRTFLNVYVDVYGTVLSVEDRQRNHEASCVPKLINFSSVKISDSSFNDASVSGSSDSTIITDNDTIEDVSAASHSASQTYWAKILESIDSSTDRDFPENIALHRISIHENDGGSKNSFLVVRDSVNVAYGHRFSFIHKVANDSCYLCASCQKRCLWIRRNDAGNLLCARTGSIPHAVDCRPVDVATMFMNLAARTEPESQLQACVNFGNSIQLPVSTSDASLASSSTQESGSSSVNQPPIVSSTCSRPGSEWFDKLGAMVGFTIDSDSAIKCWERLLIPGELSTGLAAPKTSERMAGTSTESGWRVLALLFTGDADRWSAVRSRMLLLMFERAPGSLTPSQLFSESLLPTHLRVLSTVLAVRFGLWTRVDGWQIFGDSAGPSILLEQCDEELRLILEIF